MAQAHAVRIDQEHRAEKVPALALDDPAQSIERLLHRGSRLEDLTGELADHLELRGPKEPPLGRPAILEELPEQTQAPRADHVHPGGLRLEEVLKDIRATSDFEDEPHGVVEHCQMMRRGRNPAGSCGGERGRLGPRIDDHVHARRRPVDQQVQQRGPTTSAADQAHVHPTRPLGRERRHRPHASHPPRPLGPRVSPRALIRIPTHLVLCSKQAVPRTSAREGGEMTRQAHALCEIRQLCAEWRRAGYRYAWPPANARIDSFTRPT
jgi:hypothetical protein